MNNSGVSVSVSVSVSVENYLKEIYTFSEWGGEPINSTQLANRLGLANPSISEMVRKLKASGLVNHEPYGKITLTTAGRRLAMTVVRRHRLLETFLAQELSYGWDEVHAEAEELEHAVSEKFMDRIDTKLGYPERDPHGDPIPRADGTITVPPAQQLHHLDAGHRGQIIRISDADAHLLRYLQEQGIGVDSSVEVLNRKPFGGDLQVRFYAPSGTDHSEASPTSHDVDISDAIGAALWVVDTEKHSGCTLPNTAP